MPFAVSQNRLISAIFIIVSLVTVAFSSSLAETSLQKNLDSVLTSVKGVKATVLFTDLATGQEVYSYSQDKALSPASTLKLVTTWRALKELGPEFTFKTQVFYQTDSKVLYIRGGLDPTMTVEQFWLLTQKIKNFGVTEIKKVVIDLSPLKDGSRNALSARAYDSSVSAFPFSFNSIIVTACPSVNDSRKGAVSILPPVATITGSIKSGGDKNSVNVEWVNDEKISVSGTIQGNKCVSVPRAFVNEDLSTIRAVKWILKNLDLETTNVVYGVTPKQATLLFEFESKELRKIIDDMNHFSTNHIAQAIMCRLGSVQSNGSSFPEFSCRGGADNLQKSVNDLISGKGDLSIVDGSGLSKENKISAKTLVSVIKDALKDEDISIEFEDSLSVGGRSGTVKKRLFREGLVRAKSGSLAGVSSLAGVLYTNKNKKVAFAIILNSVEPDSGFELQDKLLREVGKTY